MAAAGRSFLLCLLLAMFWPVALLAQQGATAESVLKKHGLSRTKMTAQGYNVAGYRVYQKNRFREAAVLFRKALELNENHVLANYNLACCLSRLRGEEGAKSRIDTDEIFHHLYTSIHRDPGRRLKALADKDFDPVRETVEFRTATADPARPVTATIRARFKTVSALEYKLAVHFQDEKGKELMLSDEDEILRRAGLYTVKADEAGMPIYRVNKKKIGDWYVITFRYVMQESDDSGMWHATEQVSSIKGSAKP